jgi:hypothetical protein
VFVNSYELQLSVLSHFPPNPALGQEGDFAVWGSGEGVEDSAILVKMP